MSDPGRLTRITLTADRLEWWAKVLRGIEEQENTSLMLKGAMAADALLEIAAEARDGANTFRLVSGAMAVRRSHDKTRT